MQSLAVSDITYQEKTTLRVDGDVFDAYLFQSCESPLFPTVADTSIFFSRQYQKAIATAPPDKMSFYYVRLEQAGELIGMLCFQVKDFNPGESLKKHASGNIFKIARYKVASLINLSVLCLGNTMLTGDYGFCFEDRIPARLRSLLMMQTIDWVLTLPPFRKIGLIFVKDFYYDIFKEIPESPYCKTYHAIETQPSMIMDIPPEWKGIDGYLSALKSKYRTRANKARKLAAGLKTQELAYHEIVAVEEKLHEMYLKVVEDVGFNLFILDKKYFSSVKKELGDKFHLYVYKNGEDLIGFYTVFEDADILDAHFLGYDPEVNHHYKLYLNMLLSMIDFASSRGFRQLQLSRTATEIKSSVGAIGVPVWAYLRFPNKILNTWLPTVYSFFKPDLRWEPRQPFHD